MTSHGYFDKLNVMEDSKVINQVLVRLFRRINALEEKAICTGRFKNITLNELHVIEAIGTEGSRNMTAVAKDLEVTTGTLTTSVNSLVRKGLVERVRSEDDRRVVLVSLTPMGLEAHEQHVIFHEKMVGEIIKELDEEEVKVLSRGLDRLNGFFGSLDSVD